MVVDTYCGKLGYYNSHGSQEVDGEVGQVVMSVMRADKEKQYGNRQQELFRRCVLVAAVNLLPHVQVVIGSGVELKGHAPDPVEHEEGAGHVSDVRQTP